MLLGSRDVWTSPVSCRELAEGLAGRVEVVTYPGATHDFDHPALPFRSRMLPDGRNVTQGTDITARADALARVAGFLAAHGGVAR
jgi:dienelactone hydrolase